jgi:hypothetical protein
MDGHGNVMYLPPFIVAKIDGAEELTTFKHLWGKC